MDDGDNKPDVTKVNFEKGQKPMLQKNRLTVGVVILLLIVNIIVSITAVSLYDGYFARRVAFIDIRGYMLDRKKLFLAGSITEKQFTESVDEIEKALLKADKRTVVLLGDSVVRNAEKINIDN
jgi:hypothetical protein